VNQAKCRNADLYECAECRETTYFVPLYCSVSFRAGEQQVAVRDRNRERLRRDLETALLSERELDAPSEVQQRIGSPELSRELEAARQT